MAEYIEREALKSQIAENKLMAREPAAKRILAMIDDMPTANVAPVVHGHWVDPLGQDPYCSVCGFSYEHEQGESAQTTDYCGECGAKMDEEEHNKVWRNDHRLRNAGSQSHEVWQSA